MLGLGNEATYIIAEGREDERRKKLKSFTKGEKKIGVVCGMLLEGYDNSNVTVCVILRKCQSSVLFEQFVGRCIRMRRDLPGALRTGRMNDRATATVLSYDHFCQRSMWIKRENNVIADADPTSSSDEDDEEPRPPAPRRRRVRVNTAEGTNDSPDSDNSLNLNGSPATGRGRGRGRGRPRGTVRGRNTIPGSSDSSNNSTVTPRGRGRGRPRGLIRVNSMY